VYRTQANGSVFTLLTTLSDNTTTTYSDNLSDASILGNASPVTANPGLNLTDEYYDLEVMTFAQFYETNGGNLSVVPTEEVRDCCYYENGATKQLLVGPVPSTSNREVLINYYVKPTDLVSEGDVTLCPVTRLLTLPVAIEILNSWGKVEKIPEYKQELSSLIPGMIQHGRTMAGSVRMRYVRRYARRRYEGRNIPFGR